MGTARSEGNESAAGSLRPAPPTGDRALLRALCEAQEVAVCTYDSQLRIRDWNRRYLELFPEDAGLVHAGEAMADQLRRHFRRHMPSQSAAECEACVTANVAWNQVPAPFTLGSPGQKWLRSAVLALPEGGWLRSWRDVTAVHERQLESFDIKDVLSSVGIGYALFDADESFVHANALYQRFFPKIAAQCHAGRGYPEHLATVMQTLTADAVKVLSAAAFGGEPAFDVVVQMADGGWLTLEQRPLQRGILCLWRDATRKMEFEQHLSQLAFRDPVTGLPNQAALTERLGELIKNTHAVTLIQVVGINQDAIRNSLGQDVADQVLMSMATRLGAATGHWLARAESWSFVFLLETDDPYKVTDCVQNIRTAMEQPIQCGKRQVALQARIGVAPLRPDSTGPAELIADAEVAVAEAIRDPEKPVVFFDPQIRHRLVLRQDTEGDLRQALQSSDEVWLCYQPIVRLEDRRLTGFEALARWNHPARGALSPLEFVPVAEHAGLIVPLGSYVFRRACQQMTAWVQQYPEAAHLFMSINLSPLQIAYSHLVPEFTWIIEETGVNPAQIKIEITESNIMQNAETAVRVVDELRALGCRFSIDDFGTGFSSLSNLHNLPIDSLKIDQSFVRAMFDSVRNVDMARIIIELGHMLRLEVIAEGIEEQHQLEMLKTLNCDMGQGFIFSRPKPADEAAKMIRQGSFEPIRVAAAVPAG